MHVGVGGVGGRGGVGDRDREIVSSVASLFVTSARLAARWSRAAFARARVLFIGFSVLVFVHVLRTAFLCVSLWSYCGSEFSTYPGSKNTDSG